MHAFSADALNHACYSSVKTCSWVHLHSCESVLGALLSSGPSCLPCPSRGGWQSEAQQHSNTCAPSLQHYVATCCDQHGLFLAPARTAHGGAAQSGAQARAANLAASPRQGPALAEQQQTNFFTLTPWCRVVHRPSPALYLTCPRASCSRQWLTLGAWCIRTSVWPRHRSSSMGAAAAAIRRAAQQPRGPSRQLQHSPNTRNHNARSQEEAVPQVLPAPPVPTAPGQYPHHATTIAAAGAVGGGAATAAGSAACPAVGSGRVWARSHSSGAPARRGDAAAQTCAWYASTQSRSRSDSSCARPAAPHVSCGRAASARVGNEKVRAW